MSSHFRLLALNDVGSIPKNIHPHPLASAEVNFSIFNLSWDYSISLLDPVITPLDTWTVSKWLGEAPKKIVSKSLV